MNMTTSLDNIPLKTSNTDNLIDDSNDPIVKDILNEFEKELKVNTQQPQQLSSQPAKPNEYVVNYQQSLQTPQVCGIPAKKNKTNSNGYYNEEFLRKSAIIVVIIAFIFSPVIFATILDKIPESIKDLVDNNNYYIKLLLSFVAIYLLYHFQLLS